MIKLKDILFEGKADYKYLTQVILDAKPKYQVYYSPSRNIVNIGGTGYDKGDLVKNFNQPIGSSDKIKNNFFHANEDPQITKREVEKLSKGKIEVMIYNDIVYYTLKGGKITRQGYRFDEAKQLDTKIFDQGALQDSMKQIRKLVGIEEADEKFSYPSVTYSEFRFEDGSGGFQFQWEHGVKRYGRLSLSISSPARGSKVEVTVLSAYDKKVFENKVSNQSYLKNIKTWRDLDNLTMQTVISKSDLSIKKFEKQSYAELEKERDAQAAFYGSRAKTGRIGYGLTQQPRKRR